MFTFIRIVLCWGVMAYLVLFFLRVIMSWFPLDPYGPVGGIYRGIYRVTEPLMSPVRRIIRPVRVGAAAIDFSAMIVVFVLFVILRVFC